MVPQDLQYIKARSIQRSVEALRETLNIRNKTWRLAEPDISIKSSSSSRNELNLASLIHLGYIGPARHNVLGEDREEYHVDWWYVTLA
jgi:hypothetical protein